MPAPETSRAEEVRAAIATLRSSAANSGDVSAPLTAALQKTALLLSDAREPVALDLRRQLQEETGLSMPMIEWGLLTSLSSMRHAPLAEIARVVPADAPLEVIGVVLAGNVFVAAVRGLALPLLAGACVIAKTASREGAYARAFHAALTLADPEIGARLALVQFSRADTEATHALCTGVDALSIYGSDETVEELRLVSAARRADSACARAGLCGPLPAEGATAEYGPLSGQTYATVAAASGNADSPTGGALTDARAELIQPKTHARGTAPELAANSGTATSSVRIPRVIAHGHGLSAAYVARSALSSEEQAARTAERVALDISAYDQHGCLSPHFVLVEPGGAVDPQAFAQLLAASALPALAHLLPAAEPTLQEQAERMQWQATAAVRGELYAHPTHAVSFEAAPLRPSPGGRQISIYACGDYAELEALLAPFAEHLKCVGVAGSKAERAQLTEYVQRFCSAQICRSGEMQSPPFDTWADGAPPLAGLVPDAMR